jgi:hypothetical protein
MNVQIAVLFSSKSAGFMLVACACNFARIKNQIAISTPALRRAPMVTRMVKANRRRVTVSDLAALFVCLAVAFMAFVAVVVTS